VGKNIRKQKQAASATRLQIKHEKRGSGNGSSSGGAQGDLKNIVFRGAECLNKKVKKVRER
jgi:hypothetical protein